METSASASHEASTGRTLDTLLSNSDHACINDIVQVLKKHDCLDRFGLTLLHKHFDLEDGEVLAETNNPVCRTLLVEPIDRTDLANSRYYETAWRFDSGRPITTCVCLDE